MHCVNFSVSHVIHVQYTCSGCMRMGEYMHALCEPLTGDGACRAEHWMRPDPLTWLGRL